MTETIYEAPWLFPHNCGDWILTLTPPLQKSYNFYIERALGWQLMPGFYSGSDSASQGETQRAQPPWPPLPYL